MIPEDVRDGSNSNVRGRQDSTKRLQKAATLRGDPIKARLPATSSFYDSPPTEELFRALKEDGSEQGTEGKWHSSGEPPDVGASDSNGIY